MIHMPRVRTVLAGVALLGAALVVSIRVLGPLDAAGGPSINILELSDFRDVIYDPVLAFLDGENPYDRPTFVRKYPGAFGIGLYSPLLLLLHLPFGFLPIWTAAVVYYCLSLALTVALAPLALRLCGAEVTAARALGFGALLIASRPGNWNLYLGQVALPLTIATYVALGYARSQPGLAGVGLAVATFKPTFGVPLAGLMLARGDRRATTIGLLLAGVLTGAVIAVLAARVGLGSFVSSIIATYHARATDPSKSPVAVSWRVDAVAFVARLLDDGPSAGVTVALIAGVLAFAALALRRLAAQDGQAARVHAVGLGTLAILTCIYHTQYDLVALALPLAALLWSKEDRPWTRRPRLRWLAVALIALLFANQLTTGTAVVRLGLGRPQILAVATLNSLALLVLFCIFGCVAFGWSDAPLHGGTWHGEGGARPYGRARDQAASTGG